MREAPAYRLWVALGILAVTGGLTWLTMDPGRIRNVVLVVLIGFALRIILASRQGVARDVAPPGDNV